MTEFESRFSPPDGSPFHASVHLTVGGAADRSNVHVRWLVSDVSRRVAAEQAQAASESRYRLIAESAADVVIATDGAGRVTFASPSTRTTLSFEPDDIEGHAIAAFVHPDDWPDLSSLREDALLGRSAAAVCRFRCGDGDYLPVEARVAPFRQSGGSATWACSTALRDVASARRPRPPSSRR